MPTSSAGSRQPSGGALSLFGQEIHYFDPAKMVSYGVARIPEDRHAVGVVGDLSLEENLISARYREQPFSQRGLIDWKKVREFATRIIADYDVRCPGPQAATRLLSGGNMQKLILGREMAQSPRIILANQPTRGLDIGAVGYVHQQLLEGPRARRRRAADLRRPRRTAGALRSRRRHASRPHVGADGAA